MSEEREILYHPARVRLMAKDDAKRQYELNARAAEYLDASTLEQFPPFYWRAEISNDLLDSHFTHMSEKTLKNYAEDAARGVAFLKGHDWRQLPIGYSLDSEFSTDSRMKVIADFYTVSGLEETNDLITRMKTGLVRDVSVGFYGGRAICDLCGADFWECRHWPGLKYEEKDGDTVRTELATFTIEDARLSEVSAVFDGSTPQAMILKAQRFAARGELTAQQVEILEQRYRVNLVAKTTHTVPVTKERKMTEEEILKVRSMLGLGTEGDVVASVETLRSTLDTQATRIKELESQAAEGVQYRNDLVASALAEGVRAFGNDFKKDTYEATLRTAPLDMVKQMREDWKKAADLSLPSGRHTVDAGNPAPVIETSMVPDVAYG